MSPPATGEPDTAGRGFDAVLFDLDGTLIDSEGRTEVAVRALLDATGLDPDGGADLSLFHGATWTCIAEQIGTAFPALAGPGRAVAADLQRAFHRSLIETPPPLVPGAKETLTRALETGPCAIVTSSNRESLDHALILLGVRDERLEKICAEDVGRSKPAPEPFLKGAKRLGVAPERCLVFEDSVAGLTAAKAAGMRAIGIARDRIGVERRPLEALAERVIADFTELPSDFFSRPSINKPESSL
jgi:mannitol-1-/sugar-/sorbitol-6-phosphatase